MTPNEPPNFIKVDTQDSRVRSTTVAKEQAAHTRQGHIFMRNCTFFLFFAVARVFYRQTGSYLR